MLGCILSITIGLLSMTFPRMDCHLRLTFPIARKLTTDFMYHNPPCGNTVKSLYPFTMKRKNLYKITWDVTHSLPGNIKLELLDSSGNLIYQLQETDCQNGTMHVQSMLWTVPDTMDCERCILRLSQRVENFHGKAYDLFSCADVTISPNFTLQCYNRGYPTNGKCLCRQLNRGEYCQYENECEDQEDCGGGKRGSCKQFSRTYFPQKSCFCHHGFYMKKCYFKSEMERFNFNPDTAYLSDYESVVLCEHCPLKMFWKVLEDSCEIEIALMAPINMHVGLGWRWTNFTSLCKNFPFFTQAKAHEDLGDFDCLDMMTGMAHGNTLRIFDQYASAGYSSPENDDFFGGRPDFTSAIATESLFHLFIIFRKRIGVVVNTIPKDDRKKRFDPNMEPIPPPDPFDVPIIDGRMHLAWGLYPESQGARFNFHMIDEDKKGTLGIDLCQGKCDRCDLYQNTGRQNGYHRNEVSVLDGLGEQTTVQDSELFGSSNQRSDADGKRFGVNTDAGGRKGEIYRDLYERGLSQVSDPQDNLGGSPRGVRNEPVHVVAVDRDDLSVPRNYSNSIYSPGATYTSQALGRSGGSVASNRSGGGRASVSVKFITNKKEVTKRIQDLTTDIRYVGSWYDERSLNMTNSSPPLTTNTLSDRAFVTKPVEVDGSAGKGGASQSTTYSIDRIVVSKESSADTHDNYTVVGTVLPGYRDKNGTYNSVDTSRNVEDPRKFSNQPSSLNRLRWGESVSPANGTTYERVEGINRQLFITDADDNMTSVQVDKGENSITRSASSKMYTYFVGSYDRGKNESRGTVEEIVMVKGKDHQKETRQPEDLKNLQGLDHSPLQGAIGNSIEEGEELFTPETMFAPPKTEMPRGSTGTTTHSLIGQVLNASAGFKVLDEADDNRITDNGLEGYSGLGDDDDAGEAEMRKEAAFIMGQVMSLNKSLVEAQGMSPERPSTPGPIQRTESSIRDVTIELSHVIGVVGSDRKMSTFVPRSNEEGEEEEDSFSAGENLTRKTIMVVPSSQLTENASVPINSRPRVHKVNTLDEGEDANNLTKHQGASPVPATSVPEVITTTLLDSERTTLTQLGELVPESTLGHTVLSVTVSKIGKDIQSTVPPTKYTNLGADLTTAFGDRDLMGRGQEIYEPTIHHRYLNETTDQPGSKDGNVTEVYNTTAVRAFVERADEKGISVVLDGNSSIKMAANVVPIVRIESTTQTSNLYPTPKMDSNNSRFNNVGLDYPKAGWEVDTKELSTTETTTEISTESTVESTTITDSPTATTDTISTDEPTQTTGSSTDIVSKSTEKIISESKGTDPERVTVSTTSSLNVTSSLIIDPRGTSVPVKFMISIIDQNLTMTTTHPNLNRTHLNFTRTVVTNTSTISEISTNYPVKVSTATEFNQTDLNIKDISIENSTTSSNVSTKYATTEFNLEYSNDRSTTSPPIVTYTVKQSHVSNPMFSIERVGLVINVTSNDFKNSRYRRLPNVQKKVLE